MLLAVSAVAVLVLVSGLAPREMQVRGDILGPGLRSELNQFLGTAVVNVEVGGRFIQVDSVGVMVVNLRLGRGNCC